MVTHLVGWVWREETINSSQIPCSSPFDSYATHFINASTQRDSIKNTELFVLLLVSECVLHFICALIILIAFLALRIAQYLFYKRYTNKDTDWIWTTINAITVHFFHNQSIFAFAILILCSSEHIRRSIFKYRFLRFTQESVDVLRSISD